MMRAGTVRGLGRAAVVASAVWGTACATTRIDSTAAPEAIAWSPSRLLVAFGIRDLREREIVESRVADAAGDTTTTFLGSSQVLPIGEAAPAAELRAALAAHDVDAVLVVLPADDILFDGNRLGAEGLMAFLASTSVTTVLAAAAGEAGTRGVGGEDIRGLAGQPMLMTVPWVYFNAMLFDVARDRVVWTAAVRSEGQFATADILYRAVGRETIRQLCADGIITTCKPDA